MLFYYKYFHNNCFGKFDTANYEIQNSKRSYETACTSNLPIRPAKKRCLKVGEGFGDNKSDFPR
jgi:hypothetical protein